ncbi:MAG: ribosome-binding factor A, partial [Gammaproteobacteria bacterium]|nr:ribosome-binding factor A [Gammaproteobacteria bacterium]
MVKEYKRIQRIESVMKSALSVLIHNRYEQWRDQVISITRIKVSPDLSYTKVYISLLSDQDPQPLVHFL